MKQTILLIIYSLLVKPVFSQAAPAHRFILKDTLANSVNPMLYLTYDLQEKRITDSCKLQNGSFYFEGGIEEPTKVFLRGNSKIIDDAENENIVDFFIEPTEMTATLSYNDSQSIAKLFGVHVFPTKILIDKKGFVIDRYTGTEEDSLLDKKLSEIFK